MTLAATTEAYQAQLENLRKAENAFEFSPDHDTLLAELREDVDKAKAAMEVAWLERTMAL